MRIVVAGRRRRAVGRRVSPLGSSASGTTSSESAPSDPRVGPAQSSSSNWTSGTTATLRHVLVGAAAVAALRGSRRRDRGAGERRRRSGHRPRVVVACGAATGATADVASAPALMLGRDRRRCHRGAVHRTGGARRRRLGRPAAAGGPPGRRRSASSFARCSIAGPARRAPSTSSPHGHTTHSCHRRRRRAPRAASPAATGPRRCEPVGHRTTARPESAAHAGGAHRPGPPTAVRRGLRARVPRPHRVGRQAVHAVPVAAPARPGDPRRSTHPRPTGSSPCPPDRTGRTASSTRPIDPRFPAFIATNLSEALPGPFSPSSASVTVLGTRAAAHGDRRAAASGRVGATGDVRPHHRGVRSSAVRGHHVGPLHGADGATGRPRHDPVRLLRAHRRGARAVRPGTAARRAARRAQAATRASRRSPTTCSASRRARTATPRDFVADVARLEAQAADAADTGRRPAAGADAAGPRSRGARLGAGVGVDPGVRRVRGDPAAAVRA